MTQGFLSGKKTFIVAVAGAVAGWLSYAVGDSVLGVGPFSLEQAANATWFAALAIFMRMGIKTEAGKAKVGG